MNDSLNTFSTHADNLKDLACEVNKKVKEYFLTEENRNLSVNVHSVMLNYPMYHQIISAILDFNEYKSNRLVVLKHLLTFTIPGSRLRNIQP